jgi:TctA family transporter
MILTFVVAFVLGMLIGIIPGLGMVAAVMIAWPWLITLDVTNLLIFYAVVAGTSQFTGSVMATLTGVPGELSSIPATREGPLLLQRGLGPAALTRASLGSLVGSLIVGIILLWSVPFITDLSLMFYSNQTQFIILSIIMICVVLLSNNDFKINLRLTALGIALSLIGNESLGSGLPKYDFGIPELSLGIPIEILVVTLVALPQVFTHLNSQNATMQRFGIITPQSHVSDSWPMTWPAIFRGTIIGSIAGLVPGMAFTLSSLVCYKLEGIYARTRKLWHTSGHLPSLVSAETANNAGVLTSMIPVFFFGLPIVASESLLLNLIESTGLQTGFGVLSSPQYFVPAVMAFMISAVGCAWLSWRYAEIMVTVIYRWISLLKFILITVLCSTIIYSGIVNYAVFYYLALSVTLLMLGWYLRKFDTSVVIFVFLLWPIWYGAMTRWVILTF